MSFVEIIYLSLIITGIIIAVRIIGFRHVFDVSSPAGWFLLSILAAYCLRPAALFLKHDWWYWDVLKLPPFDDFGVKYGAVIFLSLLGFAVGYGRTEKMAAYLKLKHERLLPQARKFIYIVLIIFTLLGYVSALKYKSVPMIGYGVHMERAYTGSSVYRDVNGYFVNAVFLVPACALLYFSLTGNLLNTLLLTAPWLLLQIYLGWGRMHFLLFFVGLIGIAGLLQKYFRGKYSQIMVIISVIVILLPILAALGQNRDLFKNGVENREIVSQMKKAQERWTSSEGSDLYGFSNSAFYLYYSGKTFPHAYCYPYLYTFLVQPIPRVLWNGKPLPQEMDTQQGAPVGMLPGAVGDAYHQLGWFGALIFLFHGWWIKRAAVFLANLGRPSFLAGFGFLLYYPIYLPNFFWLPQLPFFLLPALAVYLIERRFLYTPAAPEEVVVQEKTNDRWGNSIIRNTSTRSDEKIFPKPKLSHFPEN